MKILVTAFEPFNGREINPSQLVLEKLRAPEGVEFVKQLLPVEFVATSQILIQLLEEKQPDVVLSLGQAGNRPEISVERVAINLDNSKSSNGKKILADNAGNVPIDSAIVEGAPTAYFSTLPAWDMVDAMQREGISAAVSYSAGTYVCNHVMYTVLHEASLHYPKMAAGFIHVPFLPEQNPSTGYTMELDEMVKGIQTVVQMLAENVKKEIVQ